MRRSILLTVLAGVTAFASACDPGANTKTAVPTPASSPVTAQSPSAVSSPAASPAASDKKSADGLVGRWTGPEGTYLDVSKSGDKYRVEIKDLDGAKTYDGTAKDGTIEFVRNGKTETVKAATGPETGMKGFEKETACVVVTKGSEGFCRKAVSK
jgi:hypothetical protein